MKKTALVTEVLMIMTIISKAQISFEHEFTGMSAASIQLPSYGYMYYAMDATNNKCLLYNTDYTLFKSVNIPVPPNYYLADIQYVTRNLFNLDNNIEFLYVIYTFDSALGYGMYSTRVMSENGTQLLQVDGGGYSVVYPAETGSKLFIWMYDFAISLYSTGTQVYSLPGNLSLAENDNPYNLSRPFPNPAKDYILLPVPQITNQKHFELTIRDAHGKECLSKSITLNGEQLFRIETRGLPAGVYNYKYPSSLSPISSGKFIISK